MRVSRFVPAFVTIAGLVAVGLHPGCSSSSTSPAFSGDAGNDAVDETPPGLGLDAHFEGGLSNETGFNDAQPNLDGSGCVPDAGGPGPVQHICVLYPSPNDSNNECDGHHDLTGFPQNGTDGNGFDDNCNGLVDEGCSCATPGTTKPCYLVPASQTTLGLPVGWCADNSKGTVDCLKLTSEQSPHWSGQCRGAQPPFADDFCAPGDFNCDGKPENSTTQDCSCKGSPVQCPTTPLETIPYPPPATLPLKVDAASWLLNPSAVTQATGWKWTLRGGDCDNILPHPTYGMYPTQDGTGAPQGIQQDTLGISGKEHGIVATTLSSSFYPAFSLSGDYLLQGEFDLNGQHYSCLQKIQVRAPGIRAEACWDAEDSSLTTNQADLDLHVAKTTGFSQCPTTHGWSDTCPSEDCFWLIGKSSSYSMTDWYAPSPASACVGWGSKATGTSCHNPRLDRDLIDCDRTITNPNMTTDFCGPENMNVDAPADGDKFAVAVKFFAGSVAVARPHVNIYCNGERVLSTGFNPVTNNGFPQLATSGGDTQGDMWKVALIQAKVSGTNLSCDVHPTASQVPHVATDGTNSYCVDNAPTDTANSTKLLTAGGFAPLDANALCFH